MADGHDRPRQPRRQLARDTQTSDSFPVSVSLQRSAGPAAHRPRASRRWICTSPSTTEPSPCTRLGHHPDRSGTVTFTFTGQDRNIYAFHSVAHDAAGNAESKSSTAIEASTSVPDLNPPVTHVLASSPSYS